MNSRNGSAHVRTLLLVAAMMLAASAASVEADPSPPSLVTEIVPRGIRLVCVDSRGTPDPRGAFTITVKDSSGNPRPLVPIAVDFGNCPDVSICSVQGDPGLTVDCAAGKRRVSGNADGRGVMTMTIVGGVAHRVSFSGLCALVYIDGVNVTDGSRRPPVQVSAYDETGGDGLSGADFSAFLTDLFGSYVSRSDYNYQLDTCTPRITGSDFSEWLHALFSEYVYGCNSIGGSLCP